MSSIPNEFSQPVEKDRQMIHKTMRTLLEGRVAQVLNERELAINIGKADGVKVGTRFAVLAKKSLEIRDPGTHEILGTYDLPKAHVKATVVNEHFSVCRTYQYRTIGGGLRHLGIGATFGPEERIYDTLDAADESFPTPLSQEESYVEIGDRVEQVADGDD